MRAAARAALPEGAWLVLSRLAVTIYVFPRRTMQGDVDNRVKPLQRLADLRDALAHGQIDATPSSVDIRYLVGLGARLVA